MYLYAKNKQTNLQFLSIIVMHKFAFTHSNSEYFDSLETIQCSCIPSRKIAVKIRKQSWISKCFLFNYMNFFSLKIPLLDPAAIFFKNYSFEISLFKGQ